MSYDLDVTARAGADVAKAEATLRDLVTNSSDYKQFGDEFSWEGDHDATFLISVFDEDTRIEEMEARQEEMDEDPGFSEDDPGHYDPERVLGYISFNYFRTSEAYVSLAKELDKILAVGLFEFSDPQVERLWRDKIDRDQMFGVLDQTSEAFGLSNQKD